MMKDCANMKLAVITIVGMAYLLGLTVFGTIVNVMVLSVEPKLGSCFMTPDFCIKSCSSKFPPSGGECFKSHDICFECLPKGTNFTAFQKLRPFPPPSPAEVNHELNSWIGGAVFFMWLLLNLSLLFSSVFVGKQVYNRHKAHHKMLRSGTQAAATPLIRGILPPGFIRVQIKKIGEKVQKIGYPGARDPAGIDIVTVEKPEIPEVPENEYARF